MYDSLDDGDDYLRFKKQGATIGILLSNDDHDGMDEFRSIYKQKAGSSSGWIENTFDQNKQD